MESPSTFPLTDRHEYHAVVMSTSDAPTSPLAAALLRGVPETPGETIHVEYDKLPDVVPGSVDTVVLTAELDLVPEPLRLLRTIRGWLRPGGTLVCGVRNFASQSGLVQLVRSDPQRASRGVVRPQTQHIHGYATAYKLLLEAGYSPDIASVVGDEVDDRLLEAAGPLLDYLHVDRARARKHLAAEHYVFLAQPIADLPDQEADDEVRPLTFVACVNDDAQLENNLLASPFLGPESPHQLLLYRGMDSAAQGLNLGIREARNELVVLVQQDIYLPSWWPGRLTRQWEDAAQAGSPAIGGPFGVRYREGGRTHVGHAIDRDYLLRTRHKLPADVDGLDELVMVVPRDVEQRFDPALGWHLYGTDFVLQARAAGKRAVVLDIPCHHNSLFSQLDDGYHHATSILAAKWPRELPILTNSSIIDHDPRDARVATLESMLEEAHVSEEAARRRALAAERAVAELDATLARMHASRSWKWGRWLTGLARRR